MNCQLATYEAPEHEQYQCPHPSGLVPNLSDLTAEMLFYQYSYAVPFYKDLDLPRPPEGLELEWSMWQAFRWLEKADGQGVRGVTKFVSLATGAISGASYSSTTFVMSPQVLADVLDKLVPLALLANMLAGDKAPVLPAASVLRALEKQPNMLRPFFRNETSYCWHEITKLQEILSGIFSWEVEQLHGWFTKSQCKSPSRILSRLMLCYMLLNMNNNYFLDEQVGRVSALPIICKFPENQFLLPDQKKDLLPLGEIYYRHHPDNVKFIREAVSNMLGNQARLKLVCHSFSRCPLHFSYKPIQIGFWDEQKQEWNCSLNKIMMSLGQAPEATLARGTETDATEPIETQQTEVVVEVEAAEDTATREQFSHCNTESSTREKFLRVAETALPSSHPRFVKLYLSQIPRSVLQLSQSDQAEELDRIFEVADGMEECTNVFDMSMREMGRMW
ncbi:hypothetical protein DFS34DRAFT_665307 [Phlyctochytrium arcticum]|nr:hypothetical protein DFS34DRAFT_665307 [Phlyctochytrium arcticum]